MQSISIIQRPNTPEQFELYKHVPIQRKLQRLQGECLLFTASTSDIGSACDKQSRGRLCAFKFRACGNILVHVNFLSWREVEHYAHWSQCSECSFAPHVSGPLLLLSILLNFLLRINPLYQMFLQGLLSEFRHGSAGFYVPLIFQVRVQKVCMDERIQAFLQGSIDP